MRGNNSFGFILEHDDEVSLESVTNQNVDKEMSLITKNEPYLERAGEGYPNIRNTYQYEQYLLNQYGDYEAVSMKRFRVLYKGESVGQIGLHSFIVRNFQSTAEVRKMALRRFSTGSTSLSRARAS